MVCLPFEQRCFDAGRFLKDYMRVSRYIRGEYMIDIEFERRGDREETFVRSQAATAADALTQRALKPEPTPARERQPRVRRQVRAQ